MRRRLLNFNRSSSVADELLSYRDIPERFNAYIVYDLCLEQLRSREAITWLGEDFEIKS